MNDVLRISGIDAPLIASLTSSFGQVVSSFERLRMFSDYRTPASIRAFIQLCIILVPLLLVPMFAQHAADSFSPMVYAAGFLLPLPFMLLSNVQKGLENPFSREFDDNPDGIQVNSLQMVQYMSDGELLNGLQRKEGLQRMRQTSQDELEVTFQREEGPPPGPHDDPVE